MKAPNLWDLDSLVGSIFSNSCEIDNEWVPSRPIGLSTIPNRVKLAWLVFTGKVDALKWPGGQ